MHRKTSRQRFGVSMKPELQSLKAELENTLPKLSKNQVETLRSVSRFARHSDPATTMTYISTHKEELYRER